MLRLSKLFGKSPFAPLQSHMKRVAACMDKLSSMLDSLPKADMDKLEKAAAEISRLEHEADLTKSDIRNHLPRSLFLPIERSHFLEILSIQDSIADKAEDIGILLALSPLDPFKEAIGDLKLLFKKNEEVFLHTKQIIAEIDDLLESSFGGLEAEKVKNMVEQVSQKEHAADKLQRILTKQLFSQEMVLSAPSFYLWMRLIEEIGSLSHLSERLANRIRMILELK